MKGLLLIAFTFLNFNAFCQQTASERWKAFAKEKKHFKTFSIKVKQSDKKEYYYFNKVNKQLIGYENWISHEVTRYIFRDGNLQFVIYRPKRDYNDQIKGGLYYFENGKLLDKEEYYIKPIDENSLLKEANSIKEKAQKLLMTKR